ncbi:hypothetical protein AcW2_006910 [Taiwanofungus camphoratus]|nr:hypothetical protein AcW2_006910 [Antrodia cinnamomea]
MFLFRNLFVTATAAALVANFAPCVNAAPWWPMHFVMEEAPPSSLASTTIAPEPTYSASFPTISTLVDPTGTGDPSTPPTAPDAMDIASLSDPVPSASVSAGAIAVDSASPQTNGAAPLRGLGGAGALLGSTAAVLYFVL